MRFDADSLTSCRAKARQEDEESRKIVEPERTSRAACAAIAAFAPRATAARCSQPVGGIAVAGPAAATRPRAAVHALDEPVPGQLLQVAVDGDRRDRQVPREVRHGHAAVALDALEDLLAPQRWRRGVQTRSSNARRRTCTSSPRNSSIARTRWPEKRCSASSPFSGVAVIGLPITPVRENSPWSIGNEKYW